MDVALIENKKYVLVSLGVESLSFIFILFLIFFITNFNVSGLQDFKN